MSDDHLLVDDGIPLRTKMYSDNFYWALDPGIRFAVRVLHAHGIDTNQSCQGGDGHAYDWPTIDFGGRRHDVEGFAALHHLNDYGLLVRSIGWVWHIEHGMPVDNHWQVTFWAPMPERADEQPMFIWGYQARSQVVDMDACSTLS